MQARSGRGCKKARGVQELATTVKTFQISDAACKTCIAIGEKCCVWEGLHGVACAQGNTTILAEEVAEVQHKSCRDLDKNGCEGGDATKAPVDIYRRRGTRA